MDKIIERSRRRKSAQGYRIRPTDGPASTILNHGGGIGSYTGCYAVPRKAVDNRSIQNIVYHGDGPAPCITAHERKGASKVAVKATEARAIMSPGFTRKTCNGRTVKGPEEPSFTLTATDRHGVATAPADGGKGVMVLDGAPYNVRRLTPRECFRLQGFPDELFEKAAAVNSDTQLYKQAGNAVTATVSYEIGKWIMELEGENGKDDR